MHLVSGSLGVSIELVQRQRLQDVRTRKALELAARDDDGAGQMRLEQQYSSQYEKQVVNSSDLRTAVGRLALDLHWIAAKATMEMTSPSEEATSLQALSRTSRDSVALGSQRSMSVSKPSISA